MAKLSNIVITTLNVLTTILSILAISIFFYLHFINVSPSNCQRMVEWPILIMGLTLLVISLLGLIGSGCRITSLLWIYLVVLVGLILGWFIFSVFVFFVTNKGAGQAVAGVGFREYKVGDYSHWLQKHVVDGGNWVKIRSCLVDARVCSSFEVGFGKHGADFLKGHLSPIQSSCCKPPTKCGFTPKNATFWENPNPKGPDGQAVDPDCETWSNDPKKLCYDCKACKGGVLANLRREWRKFLIINAIIIILLFFVYMVGCCAVRNNYRLPKYSGYP